MGAGVFDLASVPGLVRSGPESAVFIQLDSLRSPVSRLIYAIEKDGRVVLIRVEGVGGDLAVPHPESLELLSKDWSTKELLGALRSASETRALEALCWISLQAAAQSGPVVQLLEALQSHPDRWISEAATYAWDREAAKRGRTR